MAKEPRRNCMLLRPLLLATLVSSGWILWATGPSAAAADMPPAVPPLLNGDSALTQTVQLPPVEPLTNAVDSVGTALAPPPAVPAVPKAPTVPALPAVTVPAVRIAEQVLSTTQELPVLGDTLDLLPDVPGTVPTPELPPSAPPAPLPVPPAPPLPPALPPAVVLQTMPPAEAPPEAIPLPLNLPVFDPAGVASAATPTPGRPAPGAPLDPLPTPRTSGGPGAGGSSMSASGTSDIPDVPSPLPPPRAGPMTDPQRTAAPQPSFDPGSRPD